MLVIPEGVLVFSLMYTHLCLLTSSLSVKHLFACPYVGFCLCVFSTLDMCVCVCVCVYLASRQKQFQLSSCHVPQEPRSFPAQHITLQHYREISWWKMRLILDGNYCCSLQAPVPAFFFFLSLYLLYLSIHFFVCVWLHLLVSLLFHLLFKLCEFSLLLELLEEQLSRF